jgi:hypothetical protein
MGKTVGRKSAAHALGPGGGRRMKAQDVLDWVLGCMAEAEADAYQQQEGWLIQGVGVSWGRLASGNAIWIKVGEDEFTLTVSKKRLGKP